MVAVPKHPDVEVRLYPSEAQDGWTAHWAEASPTAAAESIRTAVRVSFSFISFLHS